MFRRNQKLKNLYKLAILTVFSLFAACGGGGGDDSSSGKKETGPNLFSCGLAIIVGGNTDTWCSGSGGSGNSGSSGGSGSSSPPPVNPPASSGRIYLLTNNEFEPNNDIASANPVRWGSRLESGDKIGWMANGTIRDTDDQRDAFSIVAERTTDYRMLLCPETGGECEISATGDHDPITAFFRVLDQDGNVLATTQGGMLGGNKISIRINAGVIYYVTVIAGDTMGAAVQYNMRMYESN